MARVVVPVPLGPASYDIILGEGLLASLPELLATRCPATRYAIVTDSTVGPLYGQTLAGRLTDPPAVLLTFPAGEWNKTRETWATLTDQLLSAGLGRDAAIVALGGGVVGDVAGFVAATYLRGISYVQVPTTLLAMIDSSIGGKTGLDTSQGKNLVGAFHQPRAVIADMATLRSLPPVQLAAGMAEALKHGFIADAGYVERILEWRERIRSADGEAVLAVVRRSVEIKSAVVTKDERERGPRAMLNFGHTVGHAVEAISGYGLLHGEAIAIGMAVEAALGARLGVSEPGTEKGVREALEAFGLPTELPADGAPERLLEVMSHDKKARGGTVRFALLRRVGEVARGPSGEWTIPVADELITRILAEFS